MNRPSTRAPSIRMAAVAAAASALLFAAASPSLFGANARPAAGNKGGAGPIGQIMKQGFKGDNSPVKRITGGKGTKADAALLTKLVTSLAAAKPPKGDADDWKQRTDALTKAMDQINKGDKAGVDALQTAADCKGCHNLHKGE